MSTGSATSPSKVQSTPPLCTVAVLTTSQRVFVWIEERWSRVLLLSIGVLIILGWWTKDEAHYHRSAYIVAAIWIILFITRPFSRILYRDWNGPNQGFFGDLRQMNSIGDLRSYHHYLWDKFGPVALTWVGAKPVLVINHAPLIQAIGSKYHTIFPNRPIFPVGDTALLFERDQVWKTKKAKLMPLFTHHALSYMQLERTADASIDRIKHAWDVKQSRLNDPGARWLPWNIYHLLVEQQTHEIVEHCYNVKLSDPEVWKKFPVYGEKTDVTGNKNEEEHIFHVDAHPYILAIDNFSIHASSFNTGSQWVAMFNLFPLAVLIPWHWKKVKLALQTKKIMERLNTLTEEQGKGVEPVDATDASVKNTPDDTPSTFASEFRALVDSASDIFTPEYLRSQLVEVILGTAHTTSLLLTGVLYHIAIEPTGSWQRTIQSEVTAILESRHGQPLTVADLLDDPNGGEFLQGQAPMMDALMKESQRLYSPGGLTRENAEPVHVEWDGVSRFLPALTEIHLTNGPHRDPEYWHQPNEFRPERWCHPNADDIALTATRPSASFFPFGFGSRKCLGFNYAIAHMRLCLIHLIREFEFRPSSSIGSLVPSYRDVMRFRQGLVLLPREPCMIEMRRRDETKRD